MVALEAMRLAMIQLQTDVQTLEDCIPPNDTRIAENLTEIGINRSGITANDHRINQQEAWVEILQDRCYYCQNHLDTDKAALILYCQQFAFAPDMVGQCAQLLSCRETELGYRWGPWFRTCAAGEEGCFDI